MLQHLYTPLNTMTNTKSEIILLWWINSSKQVKVVLVWSGNHWLRREPCLKLPWKMLSRDVKQSALVFPTAVSFQHVGTTRRWLNDRLHTLSLHNLLLSYPHVSFPMSRHVVLVFVGILPFAGHKNLTHAIHFQTSGLSYESKSWVKHFSCNTFKLKKKINQVWRLLKIKNPFNAQELLHMLSLLINMRFIFHLLNVTNLWKVAFSDKNVS